MNRALIVAAALAAALLIPQSPAGAGEAPPNYAAFKIGAYVPGSDDLGGESGVTGADAGLALEGAYGRYFGPHFALEGGIGFFFTEGDFNDAFGTSTETFVAIPVTVSAKFVFPAGRFEPYLMAGVGVYFVEDEIDHPVFGTQNDDDTAGGFHVGGGFKVDVSRLMYVGAEVKYLWVEVNTFGADSELNGLTATANVGFKF